MATAQQILDQSECIACLGATLGETLQIGILNSLMPAVATDTLMSEGKCYACFGALSTSQILTLAQLRRWLISLVPAADTSPQALVAYGKCFACLGSLSMYEIMLLALLDQIAQAS